MPNRRPTCVFDADGVVIAGGSFAIPLEREHGIPRERLQPFFRNVFPDCLRGRKDLRSELKPVVAGWGWTGSVEDLLDFWFEREDAICAEILNLVRRLRSEGNLCVLATNQERHRAAYLRQRMRLDEEFDRLFVSCEIGQAKPSPEFFRHIEVSLELPGERLMLIDDSFPNIEAARARGWEAFFYRGDGAFDALSAMLALN